MLMSFEGSVNYNYSEKFFADFFPLEFIFVGS